MFKFRRTQVQPEIATGLSLLGFNADEFRIVTAHLGDRVQFEAKAKNITLTGVLSDTGNGLRISVSPTTSVGTLQSRTTTWCPAPDGWYE